MIHANWFKQGTSVWFQLDGKVYCRKIIGRTPGGLYRVNFQGERWAMHPDYEKIDGMLN